MNHVSLKGNTMDLYEVTKKLIGSIDPVGESRVDEIRFENLKVMLDLVERLIDEINDVAIENACRNEASMKKAGEIARQFIYSIRDSSGP
jgi:hypothetical protein